MREDESFECQQNKERFCRKPTKCQEECSYGAHAHYSPLRYSKTVSNIMCTDPSASAHAHPHVSKGHPRDYARNVEGHSYVKQCENLGNIHSVWWDCTLAMIILGSDLKKFVNLSRTAEQPHYKNIKSKSSLAKSNLVFHWLNDCVPTLHGHTHDSQRRCFPECKQHIG